MDRVTAAKVFIDVVNSGSFSATAERLEMSRPMVTRYVEELENWLNARLLHRTTRKISLTSAGEHCLREIESWLEQAEKLESLTAVNNNELTGNIRIAASMSYGFSKLAAAITTFLDQHSKVSIDIDLQDSTTSLVENRIDLAIRITNTPDPMLIGKPIGKCESMLVASPDFLKRFPHIEHPKDLASLECLGYKNFERHTWYLTKSGNTEGVSVRCRLTANETTVLLHATLNGAGIALQPNYLTKPYLDSGQLVQVLPDWKPNEMKVYALYPSRKHLSPAVRALITHLEHYLKE